MRHSAQGEGRGHDRLCLSASERAGGASDESHAQAPLERNARDHGRDKQLDQGYEALDPARDTRHLTAPAPATRDLSVSRKAETSAR